MHQGMQDGQVSPIDDDHLSCTPQPPWLQAIHAIHLPLPHGCSVRRRKVQCVCMWGSRQCHQSNRSIDRLQVIISPLSILFRPRWVLRRRSKAPTAIRSETRAGVAERRWPPPQPFRQPERKRNTPGRVEIVDRVDRKRGDKQAGRPVQAKGGHSPLATRLFAARRRRSTRRRPKTPRTHTQHRPVQAADSVSYILGVSSSMLACQLDRSPFRATPGGSRLHVLGARRLNTGRRSIGRQQPAAIRYHCPRLVSATRLRS